jgi:hypothetical protein
VKNSVDVGWAFFDKIGRTSEELEERDSDAIGGLEQAAVPELGERELAADAHRELSSRSAY